VDVAVQPQGVEADDEGQGEEGGGQVGTAEALEEGLVWTHHLLHCLAYAEEEIR